LKQRGCADATACQQELGNRIRVAEAKLTGEVHYGPTVDIGGGGAAAGAPAQGPWLEATRCLQELQRLMSGPIRLLVNQLKRRSYVRVRHRAQPPTLSGTEGFDPASQHLDEEHFCQS